MVTAAKDLVGSTIGPWQLVERIGEGGLATVYRAVHVRVGSRAALKVLEVGRANEPEWVARLLAEAQLVNRIDSPHVVKISDLLTTDDGRPALVMELLVGASLADLIGAESWPDPPPVGSVLVLMLDVLDGLRRAHEQSIVHRDIKPHNIFVSPDGRGTLLDFGIAKLLDEERASVRTRTGMVLGTPRYMAPEQLAGELVGPATDLYAVGEVLFEALTGRGPFAEITGDALVRKKLDGDPPSVAAIPPLLQPILQRLLRRAPSERFASAAEVAAALRAVLIELPESDFGPLPLPVRPAEPTPTASADVPKRSGPEPAPTVEERPGLRQIGPYRIEALLGQGGVGRVYRAYDPRLRRQVALKVFAANHPNGVERFLLEARSHARINHPNVCRIFDMGEADGMPYLAMQLLSGRTLADDRGGWSLRQRVELIVECGRALQAVHSLGLVHRDVKPANVLVEVDDRGALHAYLTDFGLVRAVGDVGLTSSGTVVGTPRYMAPEQLAGEGRVVDARTDVYGLGATFYELLTNRPVFDGESSVALMFQIATEDPIEPRRIVPELPRDLETIVLKCLRKAQKDRYGSTGELVDDLERWLRDEPIAARPPTVVERLQRVARRHRPAVAALVAAAFALSGFGAYQLLRERRVVAEARIADNVRRDVAQALEQLRASYLLPLHDLTGERAAAAKLMRSVGARAEAAHGELRGKLRREQASLALELQEYALAELALEEAVRLLPGEREVERDLGEVLLRRYVVELGGLEDHDNLAVARSERARLSTTVRTRALALLGEAEVRRERPVLAGLMLVSEGRYAEAISEAHAIIATHPLWYDALLLEARAYRVRAEQGAAEGGWAAAAADYDRARVSYDRALELARSHPVALAERCRLSAVASFTAASNDPKGPAAHTAAARATCGAMRVALPSSPSSYDSEIQALYNLASYQEDHGEDSAATIAEARALYAKVPIVLHTQSMLFEVTDIDLVELDHLIARGEDPAVLLQASLDRLDEAERLGPPHSYVEDQRAALWGRWGMYADRHGKPSREKFDQAVIHARRSIALDPTGYRAYSDLITTISLILDHEHQRGHMTRALIDETLQNAVVVTSLHPSRGRGWYAWGTVPWFYMLDALQYDRDPAPYLRMAMVCLSLAEHFTPGEAMAYVNYAHSIALTARFAVRHHLPFDAKLLIEGRKQAVQATKIGAAEPTTYNYLALYELMLAEVEPQRSSEHLATAEAALMESEKLAEDEPEMLEARAEVAWRRAISSSTSRKAQQPALTVAATYAQRAIAQRKDVPRTRALLGLIQAARAKLATGDEATRLATESRSLITTALAENPTLRFELPELAAAYAQR